MVSRDFCSSDKNTFFLIGWKSVSLDKNYSLQFDLPKLLNESRCYGQHVISEAHVHRVCNSTKLTLAAVMFNIIPYLTYHIIAFINAYLTCFLIFYTSFSPSRIPEIILQILILLQPPPSVISPGPTFLIPL
ncbi:hypothetical protein GUJ93_ZPchr0008g12236 [Zizania palustris]|uniref:Uncharacterized protein n=1 Tax=Zizania palustris TaxID=103762 RepID=A0A8J5UWI7_ZIZPA|nr:hypothetical protein GUJ93_ZPchr0008g12236 [Zizania palustris]